MAQFGYSLPEVIILPHELPDVGTQEYWQQCDNIIAAYKAGQKNPIEDDDENDEGDRA